MTPSWLDVFPLLAALPDRERRRLVDAAGPVRLPAGRPVFRAGDACHRYFLVLDGAVRVQMTAPNGREIVLYRVERGQTCILTTTCLMAGRPYAAEAQTESAVSAMILPRPAFDALLAGAPGFRTFVFAAFGDRVSGLLALIEEVAFGRVDRRLAQFLIEHAAAGGVLAMTHQDIAAELGSAREVVSRQLKEFERRGWVSLGRGRVDLRAPDALGGLARRDER